jgi:hypothetical protein
MALFKSTWTSAPQAADIESDTGADFMKQIQPKFTDKDFMTRDRCYDFLNIFAEKFSKKIGVF